jgi:hypothetical protein
MSGDGSAVAAAARSIIGGSIGGSTIGALWCSGAPASAS